jgi:hypothetical protein
MYSISFASFGVISFPQIAQVVRFSSSGFPAGGIFFKILGCSIIP